MSFTQVVFTMPTPTSPPTCAEPSNSLKGDNKHSTSTSLPQQTEQDIKDGAGSPDGTEGTTQILPTRYVRNVDILVEVLQTMVGEQGFQIEVSFAAV
jgi:hypothetical protein